MRPLKLTLRAFGPFAGEHSVDFTGGGENPFLLINGPTGAGKTSLLDGLCYALYGEASGAVRTERYLRSQLARPEDECLVTLRFQAGGRLYAIERRPTQNVLSRGRLVERKHAVGFWEVDAQGNILGERLSKVNEVLERVEELVGFSSDQFRQVVVLPQGDFRRLLLAKSDEKEKILEKLFGTGRFKLVEDSLRRRRGELSTRLVELRSAVEGILGSKGAGSAADLEARKAELETRRQEVHTALQEGRLRLAEAQARLAQAKLVQAAFAEAEAARTALDELRARQEQVEHGGARAERAFRALTLVDLEATIARATKEAGDRAATLRRLATGLEELEERRQGTRQALELARQEQAKVPECIAEGTRLQARLAQLQELAGARAKADAAQKAEAQARQEAETAAQSLATLERRLAELSGEIEALSLQAGDGRALELEISRLEGLCTLRGQLDGQLRDQAEADTTLRAALARVAEREANLERARRERQEAQQALITGQATRLAASLAQGQPCPVCGSREHPHPALAHANTGEAALSSDETTLAHGETTLAHGEAALPPGEETLQRAEAAVANQERALRAERDQCEGLRTRLAGLASGIAHCRAALGPDADVSGGISGAPQAGAPTGTLAQRLERAKAERTKAEALAVRLRKGLAERDALTAKRQEAQARQDAAAKAHGEATAALGAARALLERASAEAGAGDEAALRARLAEVERFVPQAAARLQAAERAQADLDGQVQKRQGERDQLARLDATALEQLTEQRATFAVRLLTEGFLTEREYQEAKLPRQKAEELRQALERHREGLASAQARLERAEAACLEHGQEHGQGQEAEAQRPDVASLQTAQTQAEAVVAGLNRELGEVATQQGELAAALRAIAEKADQSRELEADYAVVGRLAELVTGQNPLRMTLQRYVLAALFEEVARAASQRLLRMSRGRYHLVRAEAARDGRSTGGLDLDVTDAFIGESRPASTLSGGESFLASLALALGLSDVVMAQQGGRSLDCIFIDEGFGSLDGETLEFALNTLMELHSAGRLIGIISHVAELRERIPSRIDVIPSKSGSSILAVNC